MDRNPFALGDLTRSLQVDDELAAAAAAAAGSQLDATSLDASSLSHQQTSEFSPLHPPSSSAKVKQEDFRAVGGDDQDQDQDQDQDHAPVVVDEPPDSKKRKRNKPTLSCKECVDKKMKCDRGRPHCLSCIRRGTECVYRIKTVAVEDNRQYAARRIYPPRAARQNQSSDQGGSPASSTGSKPALFTHQGSTDLLLSHAPFSEIRAGGIFGIGAEYPFSNYWTQNGGLSEVLACLPYKQQADILVRVFFEAVDPVYPMISRERFYVDYEAFWELDDVKRLEVDIDFIALIFMVLAMGTQFLQGPHSTDQVKDGAEFYSSACYQSLRLFSYLNRTSVRCLQSMVFMTYFLLNSGRASDGWAFSGTLIRQAYAGGINREPFLISPKFTKFQRLERRRLWHGIVCQDSFMSMSLRLPPTAVHFDVDNAAPMLDNDETFFTDPSLESASEDLCPDPSHSDIGYVQSMYTLALLVQETISTPRSLSLPVASTTRQRNMLLGRFRSCYRSFPDEFRAWDEDWIKEKTRQGKKRLIRQIMFVTGIYWHCVTLINSEGLEDLSLTLLQQSDGEKTPVDNWIRGTLDAAYQSMRAFFVIHSALGGESSVWWAFCHRAFSVSITVADLLKKHELAQRSSKSSSQNQSRRGGSGLDCWSRARDDVQHMLDLLQMRAVDGDQSAKTRVEVLSNYL